MSLADNRSAPAPMVTRVELLLILGVLIALAGIVLPLIQNVREAAARSQSQNNLKQIGIGLHNIASVYNGLEPPVVGAFPKSGYQGPIFFHLLPHIECGYTYSIVAKESPPPGNMAALNSSNGTERIYCAPADPSNPGTNTLRTSYCFNGAVFGGQHGGSTRFPAIFNDRGTTNCIILFERFAAPNGMPRHWNEMAPRHTWLYSPYDGGDGFDDFPFETLPETATINTGFFDRYGNNGEIDFGKTPSTVSHPDKPHAICRSSIQVLLGDGSARSVKTDANATMTSNGQAVRLWAWACTVQGSLGQAPIPNGW